MYTQFTTLNEAKACVTKLAQANLIVKSYNADFVLEYNPPDPGDTSSGIYVPVYAVGPFPTPKGDGDKMFYHLRFQNGKDGFNVGLILAIMAEFPTRWPLMVATEVFAK